ncbi:uncharacterized protein TNCV_4901421 [Trichonephila clavipes]|nr:uncharacterized protein TNCV_4901421 [Trichonephila clavipes]
MFGTLPYDSPLPNQVKLNYPPIQQARQIAVNRTIKHHKINKQRSYYPYGLNVIWKGGSVLLPFKQKSEDSLNIPNSDKSVDNSNDIGFVRISRAKRRKRVTGYMTTLKNSMLELAVKFDNYNTGLIKSFMFGMNKTEIKIMTDILSRYKFRDFHGDLGIVKDDLLRNFMEKGTGFRLMITKNKSNVMKQIIKDLDKFYHKIAIKYGMPIEDFNQLRSFVATEIREVDFTVENEIMYKDLKSSVENIQNDFVITYVDKTDHQDETFVHAPHRPMVTCIMILHSSSWPSWIVVPLSLSLKFEDYITLGRPLR